MDTKRFTSLPDSNTGQKKRKGLGFPFAAYQKNRPVLQSSSDHPNMISHVHVEEPLAWILGSTNFSHKKCELHVALLSHNEGVPNLKLHSERKADILIIKVSKHFLEYITRSLKEYNNLHQHFNLTCHQQFTTENNLNQSVSRVPIWKRRHSIAGATFTWYCRVVSWNISEKNSTQRPRTRIIFPDWKGTSSSFPSRSSYIVTDSESPNLVHLQSITNYRVQRKKAHRRHQAIYKASEFWLQQKNTYKSQRF